MAAVNYAQKVRFSATKLHIKAGLSKVILNNVNIFNPTESIHLMFLPV